MVTHFICEWCEEYKDDTENDQYYDIIGLQDNFHCCQDCCPKLERHLQKQENGSYEAKQYFIDYQRRILNKNIKVTKRKLLELDDLQRKKKI